MKLSLIVCVLVFLEKLQMSRLSNEENHFFYVQSGVNQSNAGIFKELSVKNSTDPMIHCCLHCLAFSQCVWVDIIGNKPKRCRLLYGFPALIPANKTSDDTVRYQKVKYTFHWLCMNGMRYFLDFYSLIYWSFLLFFVLVHWKYYRYNIFFYFLVNYIPAAYY